MTISLLMTIIKIEIGHNFKAYSMHLLPSFIASINSASKVNNINLIFIN